METSKVQPGGRVKRVLVGIDGSHNSLAALDYAIGLARSLEAEVVAVLAVPAIVYGRAYGRRMVSGEAAEERRELKRAFRERWCKPLDKSGLAHRAIVETGEPATTICDVAEREGADLIVVGRRGRGAIGELLLGSVSRELSLRCHLPVLLVSPGGPATESVSATPSAASGAQGRPLSDRRRPSSPSDRGVSGW